MNTKKKIIFILTILCTLVAIINLIFYFILPRLLSSIISADFNDAASIGIIGSADGPSTILVSYIHSFFPITLLFILLSILGIVYLITTKSKKDN
ncbi:MAG: gcdB1 [Herbinix sp.]|jgi:Na+-transporting methylmalonyl-CoA/oxaloacetate decarboxylase beta subunit|nr:gcdB1 [Herbinix sp.]